MVQGRHRPLVEASAQGHVGLVNMLLRYRADIDATGKVLHHIQYTLSWAKRFCRVSTLLCFKRAPAITGVWPKCLWMKGLTSTNVWRVWVRHENYITLVVIIYWLVWIQDCTSPLFLAVTANEYRIVSELIKKGASVNAVRVSSQYLVTSLHETSPNKGHYGANNFVLRE